MTDGAAATVRRTGAAVRVGYGDLEGDIAERMRVLGFSASIAVPIQVAGSTWARSSRRCARPRTRPRRPTAGSRQFAELVAQAVANAEAREQLAASRARLVRAADAERRRLERNLHDGAQQRLVALSLSLRVAERRVSKDPPGAAALLEQAGAELDQALGELRELARGIAPGDPQRPRPGARARLAGRARAAPGPGRGGVDVRLRGPWRRRPTTSWPRR